VKQIPSYLLSQPKTPKHHIPIFAMLVGHISFPILLSESEKYATLVVEITPGASSSHVVSVILPLSFFPL
jgi:hypothetical protein